jgi:hypothetical protein
LKPALVVLFEIGAIEVSMNCRCKVFFGLVALVCANGAALRADEPKTPAADSAKATPAAEKEADADKLVAGDWKIEYAEVLGQPVTFTHEGKTIEPLKDAVLRFEEDGTVNFSGKRTCYYKIAKDGDLPTVEVDTPLPEPKPGQRKHKVLEKYKVFCQANDGKMELCADLPWPAVFNFRLDHVDPKSFKTTTNGCTYLIRLVRLSDDEQKKLKPTELDVLEVIGFKVTQEKHHLLYNLRE